MILRQFVDNTLKESNLNRTYTDQITASLIVAGTPKTVREDTAKNLKTIIKNQALGITYINPLRDKPIDENICKYCHKPMKQIIIKGDIIKKARFCSEDRITLPYQTE